MENPEQRAYQDHRKISQHKGDTIIQIEKK
jgi:hypothetical protein